MTGPLDPPLPDATWLPADLTEVAAGLRARAADLDGQAELARAEAARPGWSGRAHQAWAERARERAAELDRCAGLHRAAADLVDRHVREVAAVREALAAARALVEKAVAGAA
ncbi:hypothetical protein [Nocardioides sp. GY 10127]|uniref:hypothetical protein n=1 Tax=Nocardioides sp. GY 10127 TaxID=2569762 RepID=UPI0010A932C6|nr:hypothetical protein [Nocardioides sp. GY 10127]TIC82535.1 hypothetical protein E8D37_07365 [Nocardioides sp. GY 10127]